MTASRTGLRTVGAAAAFVAALTLTACGEVADVSEPAQPEASSTATVTVTATAEATEAAETTAPTSEPTTAESTPTYQTEGPGGAPYAGDTAGYFEYWTFDSGVRATVFLPEPYTPDPSAAGGGAHPEFVIVTVLVENESDAPFQPGDGFVGVESFGGAGTLVIDSANEAYGGPWGELAPGESEEQRYAFGVDDAMDVYVHLETGLEGDAPVRFARE